MLFFEGSDPELEGKQQEQNIQKGKTLLEQAKDTLKAINENVAIKLGTVYENLTKNLLAMEDSSMALNRTMGGFVDQSGELQRNLENAYLTNLDIGATFKDAAETAQGMAAEMGRMVNPSSEVVSNAIAFSKAAGMSNNETGKMIVQFQQFGGNQTQAIEKMHDLGISARKSGLDAKSFTTEVAKNLKQASLFGFKNGVKDIEEMVKKTKLLGTSLEKLQIKGAAENLLDPEKAMEAAANIQMIGGNIGALGDPFQLLYMGQKDMKKLTDEVLNMSKATFTFDKTTGAFTQTTEDMYALRAQAEALGINYEETANAGKELAKVDFVKSSTKLAQKITDEDTQNLVAGLAQISKDGKVNIDLPGLNKNFDSLDKALEDPEFMTALEEYQKNASKSDKDLALSQMSIAEKQLATENEIKNILLFQMKDKGRADFLKDQKKMNEDYSKIVTDMVKKPAEVMANQIGKFNTATSKGVNTLTNKFGTILNNTNLTALVDTTAEGMETITDNVMDFIENGLGNESRTEEIPQIQTPGNTNNNTTVPQIQTPNNTTVPQIQKPNNTTVPQIQTSNNSSNLEKIFLKAQDATIFLSDTIKQKNDMTSNNTISGKIDFGTLTVKVDAPAGIDKTILQQTLNSKQFTNHIMDMVANQKSYYTNQATIEG